MTTEKTDLTLRVLQPTEQASWDALVQSLPSGCFMQASAWAEFKQREGFQVFRYGLFEGDSLVGGSLLYHYPQPNAPTILFAPGAPMFKSGFEQSGMALLLQQAKQLARQLGVIALRIEPMLSERPTCLAEFVRAPVDLLPSETLLIDLRPDPQQILAAMKPKGRYNIHLSQRHSITTEFTTYSQAIPKFYDLLWETAQRQQFYVEPYSFFINLCQTLFAVNLAEIGFAYWNEQILATVLVIYWGNRATYLYGGRSPQQAHRMAAYALHWAAMQRAKVKGCQIYDFYGYSRDPNHSYAKFSQFKAQFGGVPVTTIGAQDYFFYDQLAETLIGVLRRVQSQQN